MSFATGYLFYFHGSKSRDQLWLWLVWTAILILWHCMCIGMPKLSASSSTPGVQLSIFGECYCVCIATRDLLNMDILQKLDKSGSWLVGISLDVSGEILHGCEAELPTGRCSPGVNFALDINSHGMTVTSRYLENAILL